ncbi:lumazine-binding protein [Mycobacterium sp. CBMA293]|uniref:Rv0361 family membrane protein n=1 Tax=unclassified Mycolicibacterium TaxID=2636767 RepID=UPI0012DE1F58|nr:MULTISPECIES: lumazine-binding protein [unclassified Mycolicibacterium]MUL44405.1 lumazine-binding protein [Mycolicibacterium sp. CBMA 360]MUL59725.1 lumazine-binding protein [Mycolicibacterium sp. CBMA 335]MUL68568.1 lumazine-binding protein [Mycolicibacterium sp. CBMA 311]MUL94041.1 lumazine-binding protein [Mycolicibacterium sp. CBMA 230]MUM06287.1 lumazine-binding protein [Mycolicibacterium sp. CBMA 213]
MTDPDPQPRQTMAPFLAAVVFIVVVLIFIAVLNILGVFGKDGPTPDQEIRTAVVGQNDGLQRKDYARFQSFTCKAQAGTQADVLARQQDSVAKNGQRYVDGVSDIKFDGDKASATLTYHFDKTPDQKPKVPVELVREDGAWKVCSSVPS